MLGIHQDIGIGVCQKMKKGIQKHCGHKHGLFMYLVTGHKNFLTQKETKIKMSSVMLFSFNAVELCVVIINEKPWTRAREVCKALSFEKAARRVVRHRCARENIQHKINWRPCPRLVRLLISLGIYKN